MILLLKEYIKNEEDSDWNDTSERFYKSISGVVFFGCAHDERTDNFTDRALRSLMFESGQRQYGYNMVAWKPVLDWFKSTTARFRKRRLKFPVRTYYELTETPMQKLESSDPNESIEVSEKVRVFLTYFG